MAFKKVDLHIHTPASSCYDDNMLPEANLHTTPQDIVQGALAAGIEVIAITDHNSAEGIDGVREAARDGLAVFPGLEFSARGGHLLALFPTDFPSSRLRHLLSSIGVLREGIGDGFYQLDLWLDDLCRRVAELGGLAIAAHVDRQSRGFLASTEALADKLRIYHSPYLSALEITALRDKARWNQGLMPNYPQGRACLQGSDAHAPNEIGRRFTYIDLPDLSLEGLRQALADYSQRIRFPAELPQDLRLEQSDGGLV